MRLPRLKLSVRGLMLVIAGFALGIGADRAYNHYIQCMARAGFYRYQASIHIKDSDHIREQLRNPTFGGRLDSTARSRLRDRLDREQQLADEYDSFRAKFERAAFFPFLPVPQYPPPPLSPL